VRASRFAPQILRYDQMQLFSLEDSLEEEALWQKKRVSVVNIKLVREGSLPYNTKSIRAPDSAAELLRDFIGDADREMAVEICLDTKNKPVAIHVISVGTLNSSVIHPREIFKAAILTNAASIILSHNHPSGDPTPSKEDLDVTGRLVEAGKIIGIDIMDHIIIGAGKEFVSLKARGLM